MRVTNIGSLAAIWLLAVGFMVCYQATIQWKSEINDASLLLLLGKQIEQRMPLETFLSLGVLNRRNGYSIIFGLHI